ncbi:hypothetical protein CHARACLAT_015879 [Characodon lateralis]|uniref:Uncharacterized protein n=1 Tax=Characodon lateralis TaxID=208331 RepID=A0ABU7F3U9_9TELE|nr:hypothetical protein [Characodon lateralis]
MKVQTTENDIEKLKKQGLDDFFVQPQKPDCGALLYLQVLRLQHLAQRCNTTLFIHARKTCARTHICTHTCTHPYLFTCQTMSRRKKQKGSQEAWILSPHTTTWHRRFSLCGP